MESQGSSVHLVLHLHQPAAGMPNFKEWLALHPEAGRQLPQRVAVRRNSALMHYMSAPPLGIPAAAAADPTIGSWAKPQAAMPLPPRPVPLPLPPVPPVIASAVRGSGKDGWGSGSGSPPDTSHRGSGSPKRLLSGSAAASAAGPIPRSPSGPAPAPVSATLEALIQDLSAADPASPVVTSEAILPQLVPLEGDAAGKGDRPMTATERAAADTDAAVAAVVGLSRLGQGGSGSLGRRGSNLSPRPPRSPAAAAAASLESLPPGALGRTGSNRSDPSDSLPVVAAWVFTGKSAHSGRFTTAETSAEDLGVAEISAGAAAGAGADRTPLSAFGALSTRRRGSMSDDSDDDANVKRAGSGLPGEADGKDNDLHCDLRAGSVEEFGLTRRKVSMADMGAAEGALMVPVPVKDSLEPHAGKRLASEDGVSCGGGKATVVGQGCWPGGGCTRHVSLQGIRSTLSLVLSQAQSKALSLSSRLQH